MDHDTIDLFAGPGGWDVAAHMLGLRAIGIECDPDACNTRRAAGHATMEGDVREYGPADFPNACAAALTPSSCFCSFPTCFSSLRSSRRIAARIFIQSFLRIGIYRNRPT